MEKGGKLGNVERVKREKRNGEWRKEGRLEEGKEEMGEGVNGER